MRRLGVAAVHALTLLGTQNHPLNWGCRVAFLPLAPLVSTVLVNAIPDDIRSVAACAATYNSHCRVRRLVGVVSGIAVAASFPSLSRRWRRYSPACPSAWSPCPPLKTATFAVCIHLVALAVGGDDGNSPGRHSQSHFHRGGASLYSPVIIRHRSCGAALFIKAYRRRSGVVYPQRLVDRYQRR